MEDWKDYPRNPDYQVSNFGSVRIKERTFEIDRKGTIFKKTYPERIAKQCNLDGYKGVAVHSLGVRHVHTMVLETFIGPKPEGMICRHLDGTRTNNNLDNLCWGTYEENIEDAIKHGVYRGFGHPSNTGRLGIPISMCK